MKCDNNKGSFYAAYNNTFIFINLLFILVCLGISKCVSNPFMINDILSSLFKILKWIGIFTFTTSLMSIPAIPQMERDKKAEEEIRSTKITVYYIDIIMFQILMIMLNISFITTLIKFFFS